MRYLRPTSLTWWAGVFLIAMGVLQAAGLPSSWSDGASGLTGVLAALAGALAALAAGPGADAAPAALIGLGAGLIGLRDALIREGGIQDFNAEHRHRELIETLGGQSTKSPRDASFDGADEFETFGEVYPLPDGESPLPPGVRDPYGPGGSRS
jgi:hypothetical protein